MENKRIGNKLRGLALACALSASALSGCNYSSPSELRNLVSKDKQSAEFYDSIKMDNLSAEEKAWLKDLKKSRVDGKYGKRELIDALKDENGLALKDISDKDAIYIYRSLKGVYDTIRLMH